MSCFCSDSIAQVLCIGILVQPIPYIGIPVSRGYMVYTMSVCGAHGSLLCIILSIATSNRTCSVPVCILGHHQEVPLSETLCSTSYYMLTIHFISYMHTIQVYLYLRDMLCNTLMHAVCIGSACRELLQTVSHLVPIEVLRTYHRYLLYPATEGL